MLTNKASLLSAVLVPIFSLPLVNLASAENKTYIEEYTYMASDIDSKVSSRAIALEQVKRALLKELGTRALLRPSCTKCLGEGQNL